MIDNLTVSVVCASMNRTDVLQISHVSWLNTDQIDEIIIVDWSSDQPVGEIIKDTTKTKVIRVDNEEFFNLPRAYNTGVDHVTGDLILKLDVDYVLNPYHNFFKYNKLVPGVFITGTHRVGVERDSHGFFRYLNGLLFVDKQSFDRVGGYNSQFKGYGYDDDDLYNRLQTAGLKQQFINTHPCCVFHVPHDDHYRTVNYHDNNISLTSRQNYYKSLKAPGKNSIDKILCVNLRDQKQLFEQFEKINSNINRFEAIDSRVNNKIYEQYNLKLSPGSLSQQLYFSENPGAVGCFISHMNIWQQIVQNKTQITLVIEDDARPNQVADTIHHYHYYSEIKQYNRYDLIQLNKRLDKLNFPGDFNGTESYIITLNGARKLLSNIHSRAGFNNSSFPIMTKKQQKWTTFTNFPPVDWNKYNNCIVAAADTFIGMCAHTNEYHKRISILHDPRIDLQPRESSIFNNTWSSHGVEFWNLHDEKSIIQLTESEKFKWWEK